MSYLYLVLGFCTFISIAFLIEKKLPIHLKAYSFISAISCMGLVLFLFTFQVNFLLTQYLLYATALVILGFEGIKNQFKNLKAFLSTNKLVFTLSLVWFVLTFKVQILQWDDFSWGSFVKHLNSYGTYWNTSSAILPVGLRYLPGLSLWENFFTARNYYSEQPLFFSLGLIAISCFQALRPEKFSTKQTAWLFVFFCAPISWFTLGLGNISTEASIGFLLAAGFFSTLEVKKASDLFVPFIIAMFLAVTKETAFLLSLLIIMVIAVRNIRERDFFSKWTCYSVAALIVLFLNYWFWKQYLKNDSIADNFNSILIADRMSSDFKQMSEQTSSTLVTFFKALFNRPLNRSFLSRIPIPGFVYIKGFYVFWMIILGCVFYKIRKQYEYAITFSWGLVGYTLVLLVSYLYFFGDYESSYLASYERYIGVYFLAFSLICIKIILLNNLWENKNFKRAIIVLIVIFPPSPKILYPSSIFSAIPDAASAKFKIKVNKSRQEVSDIRSKIEKLTPTDSRIWLIWQNTTGIQTMIVRYEIAPRKMNTSNWSIGEKYYEGDVWTYNYSIDEVVSYLKQYDYVALGSVDEKFIKSYGELFTTSPRTGSVYKIEQINNSTRLMELM